MPQLPNKDIKILLDRLRDQLQFSVERCNGKTVVTETDLELLRQAVFAIPE